MTGRGGNGCCRARRESSRRAQCRALAMVTAVGRSAGDLAAKLGPDSTANGDAGNISAASSRHCLRASRSRSPWRRAAAAALAAAPGAGSPARCAELRRNGEQRGVGARYRRCEVGGGGNPRVERDVRQVKRIFVPLGDCGGGVGVARPQHGRRTGALGDDGQRRPPGAGADDRQALHRSRSSGVMP